MQTHKKSWLGAWRDRRGGVAMTFAVCLPIALMLIGGTLDYAQAISQRQRLQDAVDAAALAAARELGLSDARRENVPSVVAAMVMSAMSANQRNTSAPTLNTKVTDDPLEVTVVARQTTHPYFGAAFGLQALELEVSALARIVGRPNVCLLALDPGANGALSLEKNARVIGQNCSVFSNSTHANSISSKNSASLMASLICTAGGRDGGPGNFSPEPLTDCPTFDDPLAGRPEPMADTCLKGIPTKITGATTLSPGTYCGGLTIAAGADVSLLPGIYIVKDGALSVDDGAKLTGADVGFVLTGANAVLTFKTGSSIDLAAAREGMMAGLLVFESRSQPTKGVHQILSDDARNLLGTIYLPRGRLHVDANSPIADKSAYTAIVARMVTLHGGPTLVLNTNYDATEVPVPDGIRGAGQPVALIK